MLQDVRSYARGIRRKTRCLRFWTFYVHHWKDLVNTYFNGIHSILRWALMLRVEIPFPRCVWVAPSTQYLVNRVAFGCILQLVRPSTMRQKSGSHILCDVNVVRRWTNTSPFQDLSVCHPSSVPSQDVANITWIFLFWCHPICIWMKTQCTIIECFWRLLSYTIS